MVLVGESQLSALREAYADERVVFTHGAFDGSGGPHPGHLIFLHHASQLGTKLVVAVSSDGRIRQNKGPSRPHVSEFYRALAVHALGFVNDVVVAKGEQSPLTVPAALITASLLRPDIVLLGAEKPQSVHDTWRSVLPDTEMVLFDRARDTPNISTTRMIELGYMTQPLVTSDPQIQMVY